MIENSDSDRTTLESLWLVTDFVQSNNIHQIGKLLDISDIITNEPRHDKTNKMSVRPAKTQIRLGIRPVWTVFAMRLIGS